MRNRSRNFKAISLLLALGCAAGNADAQNRLTFTIEPSVEQPSPETVVELDELEFAEMLNSVPLDKKSAELICKFQEKEGRNRLQNHEFNGKTDVKFETCRGKEVLIVTIPASRLFAPNDTKLSKEAAAYLAPFKRYLKDPDMYRVLVVMHTDNTGSEEYRDYITEERSRAVADWYADQGLDTSYLFPYAFGDDQPREENKIKLENNSMENRNANRRMEVYLVPGKKMLAQAKKGRIVF